MPDARVQFITVWKGNSWSKRVIAWGYVMEVKVTSAVAATEQGMSWLEFVSTMFQSLVSIAWPVAVVVSVWIFRSEIRTLLPKFQLKHNGTEVSFRLDEAETFADKLPPTPEEVLPPTATEISRFDRLADVSPRAALVEIRREVQDALVAAAERNGIEDAYRSGSYQVLRKLESATKLPPGLAPLLREITSIGNDAAHDSSVDFTKDQALRYRQLADKAIAMLDIKTFLDWTDDSNTVSQK